MPGFDPRYDPAFQRGYTGPIPKAELRPGPELLRERVVERVVEAEPEPEPVVEDEPEPVVEDEPEREPAPASAARIKEIPRQRTNQGDPVGVSPESPSFVPAAHPTQAEASEDPTAHPAAGPLPWLIALAALSVVALASGISGLVRLAAPLSASTAAQTVSQVSGRVALDLLSGPLVIGGAVGLVLALLLLIRIAGRTRSR